MGYNGIAVILKIQCMAHLGIRHFIVALPTGDLARQEIIARNLGDGGIEQRRLRVSNHGRAESQIHAAG
jgi:hypothetical protein